MTTDHPATGAERRPILIRPYNGEPMSAVLELDAGGLLLAEQLEPETIIALNDDASARVEARMASIDLELALRLGGTAAPAFLDQAHDRLAELAASSGRGKLWGSVMIAHLPAFRERAAHGPYTPLSVDTIQAVRIGVAALVPRLSLGANSGELVEVILGLLANRQAAQTGKEHLFVWPATAREGQGENAVGFNADLYQIIGTKLPIESKASKNASRPRGTSLHQSIVRIAMTGVLNSEREALGVAQIDEGGRRQNLELFRAAARLLAQEVEQGLPRRKRQVLDRLSAYLLELLNEAEPHVYTTG